MLVRRLNFADNVSKMPSASFFPTLVNIKSHMMWRMEHRLDGLRLGMWPGAVQTGGNARCGAGPVQCSRRVSSSRDNRAQRVTGKGKGGEFKPLEYRYALILKSLFLVSS